MLPKRNKPGANHKPKMEKRTFEGAFIVPAPLVEKIVGAYNEMPIKFEPILKPLIQELLNCVRGNMTVDVPVSPAAPPAKGEDKSENKKEEK